MSSSIMIGFAGLFSLLVAIGAGVPIAVALGVVSLLGLAVLVGAPVAFAAARDTPFDLVASWSLSAIPMFLLMGAFAHRAGISGSLFTAARVWLARLPGGLLVATNLASAVFAAASGSSMATAAAMARFALPEMRRAGYDPAFAAATVASAGTVGALIPPSILFILYGIVAQTSIAKLFIAGILPGLLTIGVYILAITIVCRLRPSIAPRGTLNIEGLASQIWRARLQATGEAWPGLLLVGVVIVGIYAGVFTPVEAGAAGAAAALAIALVKRTLNLDGIWQSLREASVVSAQVFFIAIGATLFKQFLLISGLTGYLADVAATYAGDAVTLMLIAFVVYLVLGAFLDALGLLLVTLPIFLPMFQAVGADPIWVGVLLVKFVEVGLITPPVGLNVYVVASQGGRDVSVEKIFKNVLVFFICELLIVSLLIFFPAISLFLPGLME